MNDIIRTEADAINTGPELLGSILARHDYLRPSTPDQFVILLEAMPGLSVPAVTQLRHLLKLARRGMNLRCVGIIDASGAEVQP